MTLGRLACGKVVAIVGLPFAHLIATAGALLAVPLTWRLKLQTSARIDLAPSMHWAAPLITRDIEHDQGPVLVVDEYRIDSRNREDFLDALRKFTHHRRRDGPYEWGVFEDAAGAGRFLETFLVESWLDHLKQHERVAHADRLLQDAVQGFHVRGTPKAMHFVSAAPGKASVPKEEQA